MLVPHWFDFCTIHDRFNPGYKTGLAGYKPVINATTVGGLNRNVKMKLEPLQYLVIASCTHYLMQPLLWGTAITLHVYSWLVV